MRSVAASDGRTLTVRDGGDPAGFPVLCISGTPGSSTIYEPHARDAEERGIRLFSYDRPGYGGSTRLKGRTVADCAADISTVCDALDIDRFASGGSRAEARTLSLRPPFCRTG
jgi:pimeloyl-ACP methyl ester carboxylesterase